PQEPPHRGLPPPHGAGEVSVGADGRPRVAARDRHRVRAALRRLRLRDHPGADRQAPAHPSPDHASRLPAAGGAGPEPEEPRRPRRRGRAACDGAADRHQPDVPRRLRADLPVRRLPALHARRRDRAGGARRPRGPGRRRPLARPLVHLVLASVCLWTASLSGPGLVKGFLAASAILQLQSFFVSLYPFCFLEMDGYHILVDLLGVPTLKHDSVRFMRETLWSKLRRRSLLNRQEVACVAYFVLSVASIAGFVALNAWVLMHASRHS